MPDLLESRFQIGPGGPAFRRTGDQRAVVRQQEAEGRREGLPGIQGVSQPGNIHIQAANGGDPPLSVQDRGRIRDQGLRGIGSIDIGLRPERPSGFQRPLEKLVLGIIMLLSRELRQGDDAVAFLGIRLVQAAFGRVVIRDEGQKTADDMGVVIHQIDQGDEGRIGMFEILPHFPQVLPHGRFREFHHVSHFGAHRTQDHPGPDAHLLLHRRLDPFILRDGDNLHQDGGDYDDDQAGNPSLLGWIHDSIPGGKVRICF